MTDELEREAEMVVAQTVEILQNRMGSARIGVITQFKTTGVDLGEEDPDKDPNLSLEKLRILEGPPN